MIQLLLATDQDDAFDLVTELVNVSPSAAKALATVINEKPILLERTRLIPAIALLLDRPTTLPMDTFALPIASTASKVLSDLTLSPVVHASAIQVVAFVATAHTEALTALNSGSFNGLIARVAEHLATMAQPSSLPTLSRLVALGLQYAVRLLSNDAALSDDDIKVIQHICQYQRLSWHVERS